MANWREVHRQDLESGEIYFQEASEVTLPRGYRVVWKTFWQTAGEEHRSRRPEMKIKDTNEDDPKVFSGDFSGVGMHRFSKFSWWMVSHPIDVTRGLITRAKAQVMILSHGIEGDDSRPGACGMRVGIVDADAIRLLDDDLTRSREQAEELASTPPTDWDKLFEQNPKLSKWDVRSEQVTHRIDTADRDNKIAWSKWWVVRGSLENENKWEALQSDQPPPEDGPQPDFRPAGNQVRLILQCNADVAAAISAGHYDELIVEQDLESGSGVNTGGATVASATTAGTSGMGLAGVSAPALGGGAVSDRESLINVSLALQEQAGKLLTLPVPDKAPLIEVSLALQEQARILLEMAKK